MPQALIGCVILFFAIPAEPKVGDGPQPSPSPISWELEFKFHDPQRIEVQLGNTGQSEVYWYMVYTVTNYTERSQMFFPTFQLVTEDLQVINTDTGISPLVFETIKERHRATHKYLIHPTKAIGELLRGDDNARESVAIWREVDLTVNNFSVYVAGLSGETRFVPNPAYDPSYPEIEPAADGKEQIVNPKHFTLRKTLQIRYHLLGSPSARLVAEPERTGMDWIMR